MNWSLHKINLLRYGFLILLGIMLDCNVSAQKVTVDSLENVLKQKIQDTTRVNVLNTLGEIYSEINLDTSSSYINKALALGQKIRFDKGIATTYYYLGHIYQQRSYSADSVMGAYEKGMQAAKKANNTVLEIRNLTGKAEVYYQNGEKDKALKINQDALKKAKKIDDDLLIIRILCEIGNILKYGDNTQQLAKEYYFKALRRAEEINHKDFINTNKSNIGAIYYQEGKLDSALIFAKDVLQYAEEANDMRSKIIALIGIGLIYNEQSDYNNAEIYFNNAYQTATQSGSIQLAVISLFNLSTTYFEQKEYTKTIETAKKGLALQGESGNHLFIKMSLYEALSKSYEAVNDNKLALKNYKVYYELKDSINNIDKNKQLEELNIQYEVQQKEAENALLKAEKVSQATINKQRTIITVISVLLALFLGGLAFLQKRAKDFKNQQNILLEQKVAERTSELAKTSEELAEVKHIQLLEEAKNRFFANVSHEFRTPLTLIQGPLSVLLDKERLSTQGNAMVQRALYNVQHLQKLVNQILDLTKFDSGQLTLEETPEIFYSFLRKTIANFESYAQSKDIRLNLHYDLKPELQLEIDKEKLEQVLNNYISNAVKFTPKGGTITVKVKDLENRILLAVEDTGIGIPKSELLAVFDRFYQVKSKEENAPLGQVQHYAGGTGIGLSLCKEYAALMNGKAWAESELGKGSTFYFEFPKKEIFKALNKEQFELITNAQPVNESYLLATNVTNNPQQNTPKNNTILVVEDNYDLRDFIVALLKDDYHVIAAENGQAALDILNTSDQLPSLILSDVMMPVLDGFGLLEKLKNSDTFRHIPVMMLTARAEQQDKLKALRIGVDDYMLKPFDNEELSVRVQNLINNLENRRTNSLSEEENVNIITEAPLKKTQEQSVKNTGVQLSSKDIEWLKELEQHVIDSITDFDFNADILAAKMLISRSKLFRTTKRILGMTVNAYIKEVRLQTARKLIENGEAESTKEVAYSIGYKNVDYFAQSYKKRFGKRPSSVL